MTTEAKLKKLEEDQIILEDQNCKLAKVTPGACRGRAELGRGHGGACGSVQGRGCPPLRRQRCGFCSVAGLPHGSLLASGARVVFEGMFLMTEWGPREGFDVSPQ